LETLAFEQQAIARIRLVAGIDEAGAAHGRPVVAAAVISYSCACRVDDSKK
jgi:ribonuclease HII